jgi:hypothetical protein
MNFLLAAGQLYIPSFVKKRRLRELFDVTAGAFQCQAPGLEGIGFDECLRRYALFTRDKAEEFINRGNDIEIKLRLYNGAYGLAQRLRRNFHIDSAEDVMKMAKIVYRILKIDFESNLQGDVLIQRCYFSAYYSRDVCRTISSIDEGFLEGLSGGTFRFSQRMTEGKECCLAHLSFSRNSS